MALEASSLQVVVSGSGIEQTTKQLEALAVSADKAEQSTTKLAKSSKDSSKAQVDAAQEAASKYNAIIDMMTEKSNTYYADKAMQAAQASQQELFDGMAMMDKLYAASQSFYEKDAALRAQQTADVLAQQQKQMDAASARYAAEQELANRMNAAYDKRVSQTVDDAHGAALIEDKKRAWQALGAAQAEALRINKELDAAQKALENDHGRAIIEDKQRAWKALGQSQSEAMAINARMDADEKALKADADAFVATLKRQAETVGLNTQQLREYNAEQARSKAAQLGVSQQVEGYITTLKNAKGPHEQFNMLTAGSAREMMVLGHELSQGNFQRFGGSMIVLGERINFLPKLLESAGGFAASLGVSLGVLVTAIAAVVAVLVGAIITFNKSSTALHEMRNEVVLTGHSIGATGDQLYDMANKIGNATGEFGKSRAAVIALASTGKFTADQIGMITEAAVGLEKYGGVSLDTITRQFERLAAEPIKASVKGFKGISDAAVELNQQLHFLEPAVLAEIMHLERVGDVAGASQIAIKALANAEKERIEELKNNLTPLGSLMDWIGEKASKMWNQLFHKDSMQDQLNEVLQHIVDASVRIAKTGGSSVQTEQLNVWLQKSNELQDQIAAKAKTERDKSHKAEIDNAADVAMKEVQNIMLRGKYETKFQEDKARLDKLFADMRAANMSNEFTSEKAYEEALAVLKKADVKKEAETPGLGMSKVNSTIARLQAEFEKSSYFADKEMKLEQDKVLHHEVSAQKLWEDQQKYFDNRSKLIDATEAKEIAATQLYDHNAKNQAKLAEEAETKKFEIEKRYGTLRDKLRADREAADVALDRANNRGENSEDAKFAKETLAINASTLALQHKIDGYNLIPKAARDAGLSEKQMQDYFTQAQINGVQEQIEAVQQFDGADSKATAAIIARLKARKTALESLRDTQKNWEGIQTGNSSALNSTAALTKVATEQVKMWKDAGNEIEKSLTQAFGNAGQAAGKMFKAFAEGQASQIDIADKIRRAQEDKSLDEATKQKQINDLQMQGAQAQLGSYGNMADAAKGFFDENSKGYEAMTKAAQVLHAAEVALSIIKGVNAILTQGGGDPYSAFARMAAMTAIVAGLGVAISGGGGGMTSQDRQKTQGTGSVLGSPTIINGNDVISAGVKSDSIARSISILEKNSSLGLAQNDTMLGYMKNVSDNITSFAAMIVRTTGITGNLAATEMGTADSIGNKIGSIVSPLLGGFVGKVLGKVGNAIFGGDVHTVDTGFTMGKTSLANVVANGVSAQQYTDTKTDGGLFHGDSYNTKLASLGQQTNDQFAKIIVGMSDTITAAAKSLGMCTDTFTQHLQSFVVDIGNISLKGLSGDEIQKQLEAVFSKLGDDMAQYGLSGFEKFQKVGEGYLETVARVANDFMQVQDVFAVLGKSLKATGVDAASAAENLISAAGGLDNLTKGTKTFVTGFLTNAQQLAPITKSVNDQLATMGLSWVKTREQFAQVVQCLDLTTEAGQKQYAAMINLADAFAKTHAAIVDTTLTVQQIADQRKSLMDELDTLTLTNVELLKKQRDAIDQSNLALYDQVQAIKAMQADSANGLSNVDGAFSVLQSAVDRQKKSLKDAYDLEQKQIQDKLDLETKANEKIKTLASGLHSTLDSIQSLINQPENVAISKAMREDAQQQLQSALQDAKTGKGLPDAGVISNALKIASTEAKDMFGSVIDYRRDLYRTQNTVSDLSKMTDAAQSTSDQILETLKQQKDQSQLEYDKQIQALDDTVNNAQEQINVLKGQSTTLLSIDQALKALALVMSQASANPLTSGTSAINNAYETSLGRAPDAAGLDFWKQQIAKGTPISDILGAINNSPEAKIQGLYQSLLGRTADGAGLDFWTKQMNNGMDISAVEQAMKSSSEYLQKVPHFAKGINDVPEDMLAVVHKGERILPQADNLELMQRLKSPQSNAETLSSEVINLRSEIASLKETIRSGDIANVQQTKEVVKYLKKFDVDGMPETRNVDN